MFISGEVAEWLKGERVEREPLLMRVKRDNGS
jgi:hypothetical protein